MRLTDVIWDLDGTLADTLPLCIASFRSVFQRFLGRVYTDEEIVATFGSSEEGTIRRIMPGDWRAGEEAYLAEYERRHDEMATVFPGIEDALGRLRGGGIRLAIVTGKGERSAAISLRRLGLAPYFDAVEAGSPDGPIKPAAIRRVLARWGAEPAEVIYVGDTPYDAEAAAEVGVGFAGAAWAATSLLATTEPGFPAPIFDDVARFQSWLEQHLASGAPPGRPDAR